VGRGWMMPRTGSAAVDIDTFFVGEKTKTKKQQ
jgi:hypothetical protein